MYRERTSAISGAVVWTSTGAGRADGSGQRVLPDGCMDLIWTGAEVLVAGPDTAAHVSLLAANGTITGLRFPPGTAPSVLGLPAHAFRDQRVALSEVWGDDAARRLADRAGTDPSPGQVLEAAAAARLRAAGPPPPLITAVADDLRAGRTVAAIADEVGLSERQLHRRSLDAFGYGPKTLAKVLRMQRALDLARAGASLGETAFRAGYADQAHLARDVKALAGVPVTALLG